MLKVLGIVGSPRKGNTYFLVEQALEAAKNEGANIESIFLGEKDINPCIACENCKNTGECSIPDDMEEILSKINSAHGIIMGSPVYFGTVSAQTKILMDRSRPLRTDFKLKNKVCGAIAVGAARNGGQETTCSAIHDFFLIHDAIVVGDGQPTAHYGGTGMGKERKDCLDDHFGIETSKNLGKRMALLLRNLY